MKRSSLTAAFILAAVGALAGRQSRPANAAATRPATQAGKRAKALKANLDSFALHLSYLAVKKEQSAAASLSTWKGPGPVPKGHPAGGVRINRARALAIIDHLDRSGVLSRLLDPQTEAIIDMAIPMPHLHVQVIAGKHSFQNWLPIDPKAVDLVEALGKLLDGDAAKATAKVTKALEPYRKMWRQKAALFVKRLKAVKGWLGLVLRYHPVGLRDRNAYPNLHLRMVAAGGKLPSPVIGMSRREAMAAIDALARAGYFERAGDITWRRAARTPTPWPEHKGPCYSLTVSNDNRDYHANLGWDLKMLERLDALRKALDKGSDAGKAMDKLLAALEPQRKEWQKAAATKPAPAARPVRFKTVGEALAFLVACIDRDDPKRLSAACISERPRAQMYFNSLAALHAATPLPKLYAGKTFPKDKSGFKLGGHGKKWRHIHIDFIRKDDGWALADILVCK